MPGYVIFSQCVVSTSYELSSRSVLEVTDHVFLSRAAYRSQRKKRGFVAYSTDRENEVSNIFKIITPGSNRGGRFQFQQTFEFCGPHSDKY